MTLAPHASLAQAPLEPGFAAFLLQAANSGMPPIQTLSPDQARQMYRQLSAELSQAPPAVASVRDLGIPGPAGTLTLRAYSPPLPRPLAHPALCARGRLSDG